jgi:hypothetical protein
MNNPPDVPIRAADRRFFLRLAALEFPWDRHAPWLVSGAWYAGRFVGDDEGDATGRQRVQLMHPGDAATSTTVFADQLESDSYPL